MTTTTQAIDLVQEGVRNWYCDILSYSKKWIATTKLDTFTSEDIIESYRKAKLPEPSEVRVWGAVMRALAREGFIKKAGFREYKNPAGHSKPSRVWKKYKYFF